MSAVKKLEEFKRWMTWFFFWNYLYWRKQTPCNFQCNLSSGWIDVNMIFSIYLMRLSRIWRILQIKEGVIHRGRYLQNSSYPTKAEFNNCFIIHSKYFLLLKGVSPLRSLFFRSPNITQPCPQIFSVNGSIICCWLHFWRHFDVIGSIISGRLHFWRHWFNMAKILAKFGEKHLVMVNYACGFNQSETRKYFEWIIIVVTCIIFHIFVGCSKQVDYMGFSFDTIAGFGPNGAIIHYRYWTSGCCI